MIYREEHRDLFTVPREYMLCHCISSDFRLGAGIATQFSRLGVRDELRKNYKPSWNDKGYSIILSMNRYPTYEWVACVNLITKQKYWHKPTLLSIEQALIHMRDTVDAYNISGSYRKLAMPCIGCGLDKLRWEDVSAITKKVFAGTDFEILVCKQ